MSQHLLDEDVSNVVVIFIEFADLMPNVRLTCCAEHEGN